MSARASLHMRSLATVGTTKASGRTAAAPALAAWESRRNVPDCMG